MTRRTPLILQKGFGALLMKGKARWGDPVRWPRPQVSSSAVGRSPVASSLLPTGAGLHSLAPWASLHLLPRRQLLLYCLQVSLSHATPPWCFVTGHTNEGQQTWAWVLQSCFSDISYMNHFGRVTGSSNIFSFEHFPDSELEISELVFPLFPLFKD